MKRTLSVLAFLLVPLLALLLARPGHALEGLPTVDLDLGVARLGAEDVEVVHEAFAIWVAGLLQLCPAGEFSANARRCNCSKWIDHPTRQSDVRGPPAPLTGSVAGNGTRAMRAIISGVGALRHKSAV